MEKYNPLENIESARIIADAAKPLIDIAREKWVNDDQKKFLDDLAIIRGEKVLEESIKNNNSNIESKVNISKENIESEIKLNRDKIVNDAIKIIENSPEILFIIGGRGNILNKKIGNTDGYGTFYFDKVSKKMIKNIDYDFPNFDRNLAGIDFEEEIKNKIGIPQYIIHNEGIYTYLIKRLLINGTNNIFLKDSRLGQHFTSIIRYNKNNLSSINNDELKKELENPKDVSLINEILDNCSQKYIPDYYNSVVKR